MQKTIKTILIGLVVTFGTGFLLIPLTFAQAQDVDIQFSPNPLFKELNILPGDSFTGTINVTNNTSSAVTISIRAKDYSNSSDDLSQALTIELKEDSSSLYLDSLSNFYTAGEITLSEVVSGGSAQYDITVLFPIEKGDEWQGKTTNFDIVVRYSGDGGVNGEVSGSLRRGSSGGLAPLITYEETVSDIGDNSVTITWRTKISGTDFPYPASSQVIYAAAGESHVLDLNDTGGMPPKYGYAHTTPEYDTSPKVISHSVTITGLTPGTTYYYRCVSRGSLAVSKELVFTTAGVKGEVKGEEIVLGPLVSDSQLVPKVLGEEIEQEEEIMPEEGIIAAEEILLEDHCWIFFFGIIILIILYLLFEKKREGKKKWIFPFIILLAIILYCVFCRATCWILIIVAIVLFILSVIYKYKISKV